MLASPQTVTGKEKEKSDLLVCLKIWRQFSKPFFISEGILIGFHMLTFWSIEEASLRRSSILISWLLIIMDSRYVDFIMMYDFLNL